MSSPNIYYKLTKTISAIFNTIVVLTLPIVYTVNGAVAESG